MSTTHEDAVEHPAGRTVGGAELVIVPTKTGMYAIESRGPGNPPAITNDLFTNLTLAKRAVDQYRRQNAVAFARKERNASRADARREAATELKNGKLDSTIQNEEE